MSFLSTETSVHGGRPVELYDFVINLTHYRFTSADQVVTHEGADYVPVPIGRTSIEQSDELAKAGLTISTARDNVFVAAYTAGISGRLASVTVFRGHAGDGEFVVMWKGRVISLVFEGAQARIGCESLFTALRRQGLRARYQALCRHALYSAGCGVSSAHYQVTGTVLGISGSTVTLAAAGGYAAGWFVGGFVRHGDYIYRSIEGHAGSAVALDRPIPGLAVGDTLRLFPGCDHTSEHCRVRFDNLVNYGGFEFIPGTNPFSSLGNNLL